MLDFLRLAIPIIPTHVRSFDNHHTFNGDNQIECPKCYSKFRKELLPFHMSKCVG
ncbi:hypothetical protein [Acinetobacter cumulans]|uniref:hypothetical protein n=1 Tax=Acinetobacter cumulans TaxID=2136182 RepID=UPI00148C4F57|nr:hypothetical protein [Acinetobacter cumulans]